jgi:hypothetical protein
MSRSELLGGDPSARFGREEGLEAYNISAKMRPDSPVEEIALQATLIAMVARGRFDVDAHVASGAVVDALKDDLPEGIS